MIPNASDVELRHDHRSKDPITGDTVLTYETIRDDLEIVDFPSGISDIQTLPLPQYHANGYLYNYVISVLRYTIPRLNWIDRQYYHYDSTPGYTPSPFSIHYTGPANYSAMPSADGLYQDTTLKAIFTPNQYTISYELGGGAWPADLANPVPNRHTWSFDTEIPTPVRSLHVFTGWTVTEASGKDITAEVVAAGGKLPASVWDNVTFTANWVPVYIQINPNGGVWNGNDSTVDVPRDGSYTFAGWSAAGVTITDGRFTMPAENVLFRGFWTQSAPTDTKEEDDGEELLNDEDHYSYMQGFGDGTFRPYEKVTRAQFTKIAVGFFNSTAEEYSGCYSDVSSEAWYREYVEAATRIGLVDGFEDGSYHPNEPITRAQVCTIVNRALGRKPVTNRLLGTNHMILWPDVTPTDPFYADVMEATNSHEYCWYYVNGDPKGAESWTSKLPQRDWAALEESWSTAHSAPGGDVAIGE